ncbi:MAG: tetratricopeptide repeat protein [Flavobacteriaceae bacterium]
MSKNHFVPSKAKKKIFKNLTNAGIVLVPLLAIYSVWFNYGFIQIDDGGQLLQNTRVHGLGLSNIVDIFTSSTVRMYQPLTSFSFAVMYELFGITSAFPFHVFSFILHLANTYLVYQLSKKLVNNKINPLIISLVFSLHPLAIEAVAWVSATSTLMFTHFFLLSLLFYIKFLRNNSRKYYGLSILFFLLGAFCKVQIIPLVGVLFLTDYFYGKPLVTKKNVLYKIPFLTIALIFVLLTLHFRSGQSGFTGSNDYHPWLLFPSQITWYVYKSFLPIDLGIVYDWPERIHTFWIYASYVIFAFLGFIVYRYRKNKLVVFGAFFYLFNIVLHTVFFSRFLGPYADRYAYLSCLGIWFFLMGIIPEKKGKAINFIGILFLGFCFVLSKTHIKTWENTITLWSQNLKHEKATFSNGMRGNLYYEAKNYEMALTDFEKVDQNHDSRFEPEKYGYLYSALGHITSKKNPQKSAEYYLKAAKRYPTLGTLSNAAKGQQRIGNYKETEELYLKGLSISKSDRNIFHSLSALYFETEAYQKGINILTEALDNGHEEGLFYCMRSFFYLELDQYDKAKQDYLKAGKIHSKAGERDLNLTQYLLSIKNELDRRSMKQNGVFENDGT